MGLTASVALATQGLSVTQSGSALVAANIAGASTDGYTAKTLNTEGIYSGTGLVGFKTTVSRAFDQEVYDQLVSSTATTSYLDTKNTYVAQIDSLVGSTESGAALPTALATFSADLKTLAAQPSNSSAKIEVVNSGTVLAQTLNSLSSTVSDLSTAIDGDIASAVADVNSLTTKISDLNKQIQLYGAQGADVTGLEDQRDQAVLKLSTHLDVQVKPQLDGTIRVSTASGQTLVDNAHATQLTVASDGTVRIDDGKGTGADVFGSGLASSGSLAALVEVRDELLPQVQSQLDQVAAGLATALSDTTTSGTAVAGGYDIDTADLASGNRMTLTYLDGATNTTKTVTIIKVTDASVLPLDGTATQDPNDTVIGVDFSAGTTAVAAAIQTALGTGFTVTNPSGTTVEITGDGVNATVKTLTKTVTTTTTQSGDAALPLFTDGSAVYTGSFDGTSQIDGLASRIKLNSAVAADPSLLVAYSTTTEASDTTRPDRLVAGLSDTTAHRGLGGDQAATSSTVASYANAMVAYWGGQASTQKTLVDNQSVIQSNLTTRMSSASAVSTDTELSKLIQLQTYYTANARVLSTVRDMLSALLNAV